jgi:hypothetical protein
MVDFETPVCKIYYLFISADAAQEEVKREESAAAHWCFEVYNPYINNYGLFLPYFTGLTCLTCQDKNIKYNIIHRYMFISFAINSPA